MAQATDNLKRLLGLSKPISLIAPTSINRLVVWLVLGCCLWLAPDTANAQGTPVAKSEKVIHLAQRNEFYVPKPSTTRPAPQNAAPRQAPAAPASGSKILYSRISGFSIPFKVDQNDEAFVEVHLYSSANQGATWEFYDRQPTTAKEFPFRGTGEGEYWFAIKTLDRNRRLLPEGDPQPELRIIVDTSQPKLEMTAAADPAGRIVCRWNASDKYLKPQSLQLQYKPSFDGATQPNTQTWQSVTVNTPAYAPGGIYVDQLAFWPETTVSALDVRINIADEAGNVTSANRRLKVERPTWRHSNRATARPTDRPAIDPSRVPLANDRSPVRNMKCEDGSCEIPPVTANDPQWRQAFYSKLRGPGSASETHRTNQVAANQVAANQGAGSGRTVPPAIFRKNPYASNAGSNAAQVASGTDAQRAAIAKQRIAMLIGSRPEFAAPPVPAGWTLNGGSGGNSQSRPIRKQQPPQQFQSFPPKSNPPGGNFAGVGGSHSKPPAGQSPPKPFGAHGGGNAGSNRGDVWQSEVQRGSIQSQTSVGSTLAPDHRMLPVASGSTAPRRTNATPANPNQIEDSSDRWVSKSSTNFPRNQYQGLDNSRLPGSSNSQLAPRLPGGSTFETIGNSRPIGQLLNTGYTPTPRPDQSTRFPPTSVLPSGPAPANIGRASVNGPTKTNTQIISTKRFRLNYDINAVDPSGVGRVDLYLTQDKGRTWGLWGQDPDNQSPFPVEVKDQGLYGFRVVVHSKDGLVGVGPSSGDDADMWVRVDSQTPLAQITSVPYGRGNEVGRLVINYRVSDDFLTLRPVRISYSRAPQGPWTIIEDHLRNDGRYLWKVDRAVPDRIFLKVDAIDLAGNVGTHRLSQSVDVSGLVPRGTIHGVEPVGQ